MNAWFRIGTSSGWIRWFYGDVPSMHRAMMQLAVADYRAHTTARPAYREMIDTLDWSAIL